LRKFISAVVALVVLVAAYWGWALVGAAQLVSVASQGNAQAVMQRVDLPALRRPLNGQIAHAYLGQNPQFKRLLSIEQGFVGSVGPAEALLREIAALLNEGRAGFPDSGAPIWRMPPLGEAFRRPFGGLEELLFRRPAQLRRRAGQLRGPIQRPPASLGDDLAPVRPRHSRGSQRSAGVRDRTASRRLNRAPGRVTIFSEGSPRSSPTMRRAGRGDAGHAGHRKMSHGGTKRVSVVITAGERDEF
jgi:hypothetical protein